MEINKKIFAVCALLGIILLIGINYLDRGGKPYDVLIGIFTGIIVSMVITLINYFHERKKLLNAVYLAFSEIYCAFLNISNSTSKFLSEQTIDRMEFENILSLAKFIEKLSPKNEIALYEGFWPCGLNDAIKNFQNYNNKLINLRSITQDVLLSILKHEINIQKLEAHKIQNTIDAQNEEFHKQQHDKIRVSLLIRIAKLHEYQASLTQELDELLMKLSKEYKFKEIWSIRKKLFEETFMPYL